MPSPKGSKMKSPGKATGLAKRPSAKRGGGGGHASPSAVKKGLGAAQVKKAKIAKLSKVKF